MQDILRRLEEKRDGARAGGGGRRVDAQHGKGKLTARAPSRFSSSRRRMSCMAIPR